MIEVNETIEVPYAPRTVWSLLSDPHAVVECVPGAVLVAEHGDGTYEGTMTVQFGPVKVTFRANVTLELDDAAMSGRVIASGKDKNGTSRFNSTMNFKVEERSEPGGAIVPVVASVEVGGRLATVVETGAKFVVQRLTAEFSKRLEERCAGASQAPVS